MGGFKKFKKSSSSSSSSSSSASSSFRKSSSKGSTAGEKCKSKRLYKIVEVPITVNQTIWQKFKVPVDITLQNPACYGKYCKNPSVSILSSSIKKLPEPKKDDKKDKAKDKTKEKSKSKPNDKSKHKANAYSNHDDF